MNLHTPPVDLVMITYGNPQMCYDNIMDLMENTKYPNFKLTVIDNQSLDETWSRVCDALYMYPDNSFAVQTHTNLGYGQACNLASRLTQNPYIIFLNSDIQTHHSCPDWVTPIIDTFIENDDIAVVGPKLVNRDGLINGAGVVGTNKERQIRGYMEQDTGQYNRPCDVISVCGAVYAVRRDIFEEQGGFNPQYRHYFEEEEYSFRVRREGLRVHYQPHSTLVHTHMGSCRDMQLLQAHAGIGEQQFLHDIRDMIDDPTHYPIYPGGDEE